MDFSLQRIPRGPACFKYHSGLKYWDSEEQTKLLLMEMLWTSSTDIFFSSFGILPLRQRKTLIVPSSETESLSRFCHIIIFPTLSEFGHLSDT